MIEAVRSETDKEKRSKLKKETLPCVVPGSEPQTQRDNVHCTPNGIICLDFDGIPSDELESAKQAIAEVAYVFTVSLSVSGNGLLALAAYDGMPNLKNLLTAMQADFPYEIDKSCSDVSRLRFVTWDDNLIVKDEVFPAILTEQKEVMEDVDDTAPLQYVAFPIAHLPSTLANFVLDAQRCINLKAPAMPAVSVLAVIASIIGSSCRIEIKPGYTEPVALFVIAVADSGSAKTAAIKAAVKYLKTLQAERRRQRKRAEHDWKQVHVAWKKLPKDDQGDEPKQPPPAERFIIGDITLEAVGEILENNPLGVLLHREEVNAFLAGMDAYRKTSTDLQSWIEIFDGESILVDRKKTEPIQVDHPSVAIVGGIQPKILKNTIQKRPDFIDTGFGSRLLFVMPQKEPVEWNENIPDASIVDAYEGLIDGILADRENALIQDDTGINAFARVEPFVFPLSIAARRVLFDFQKRYARQAHYEDTAKAAAMHKAGRIAARLCLTLHCVRAIEMTGHLRGLPDISEGTAENAVVLASWFIHESERVYAMLAGARVADELTDERRAVMRVLQRKDKPMTSNEIRFASNATKEMSIDNIEQMLRELIKLGRVVAQERQQEKGKGRPATEYKMPENL